MNDKSDKEELARMIRANFEAFAAGDIGSMKAMDHPDSTIWDLFEPELFIGAEGRKRFRENDRAQMQQRGKLHLTVEEPIITDMWDDTALVRYYLHFHYDPPNPTSARVRITDVFRKIDGQWLRVHHHEGAVPTGVPPITEPKP